MVAVALFYLISNWMWLVLPVVSVRARVRVCLRAIPPQLGLHNADHGWVW